MANVGPIRYLGRNYCDLDDLQRRVDRLFANSAYDELMSVKDDIERCLSRTSLYSPFQSVLLRMRRRVNYLIAERRILYGGARVDDELYGINSRWFDPVRFISRSTGLDTRTAQAIQALAQLSRPNN